MPSSTPRERHCNHSFPSIFDFTSLYPSVLKDLKRECAEVRISCKKIQKCLENLESDKSSLQTQLDRKNIETKKLRNVLHEKQKLYKSMFDQIRKIELYMQEKKKRRELKVDKLSTINI